jgi:5-methylthioadenosine/S-adenosylhomocysteine deaminase
MTVHIIAPEWVATVVSAPGNQVGLFKDFAIAINTQGKIEAVGPAAAIALAYPAAPTETLPGHLVTPGLINLHTHAAMSLLRGFADDLPLDRWLKERIWPLETQLIGPDFVYDGSVLAAAEMLLGGTTCFNDMYFYPESAGRAVLDLGLKANLSMAIIDFPTTYATDGKDHIKKGLAARDALRGADGISFSLAPHAPYTVGDETFSDVVTLAEELGIGVHCHIHETNQEITDSLKAYGVRPLARLKALGLLEPSLIAAHCVHLNESEIEWLADAQASIAHCPHSNLKLASGIAPISALLKAGVNIGIGTDGSASNNRLDTLAEARTASLLAKGNSLDATVLNAEQTLIAMTRSAAQALGRSNEFGQISTGLSADLVAWDLTDFSVQPVHDPISQLIYAGGREHVAAVWINGQPVVRKRQLVGSTPHRVLSEVTARIPLWHNRVGEILSAVA